MNKMNAEYKEYRGVTHGPIIEAAMPDIFAFFAKAAGLSGDFFGRSFWCTLRASSRTSSIVLTR